MRLPTVLVHAGRPAPGPGAPVNAVLSVSSTYRSGGTRAYGRDSNVTWEALENVVGALEGGEAVAFASGMAAIAAVIESLPPGAPVVVPGDSYNGTRHFLDDLASRGRVAPRLVDACDTPAVLAACEGASLLWMESPTNPLLRIADLRAICAGARERGVASVVDNTFSTPLLQRPLELGADVVVHSATKYLSGHSDVLGGVVVSRDSSWLDAARLRRSLHGAVLGSFEAFLILRGIRTLDVRLARAQGNAMELARRLTAHPCVRRVRYPGLPDDAGHLLAGSQMEGFGAMLSFEVGPPDDGEPAAGEAAAAAAERVCAAIRIATDATSLGGVETLMERRKRWGWEDLTPPGLIRVSVGIEDVEDLWEDLDEALSLLA